jgi:protein disulfide-isomerase
MKKIFLLFALFFCHGYSTELNWYTDVKEAISLGNKEDKPLLLFSQEVIVCG